MIDVHDTLENYRELVSAVLRQAISDARHTRDGEVREEVLGFLRSPLCRDYCDFLDFEYTHIEAFLKQLQHKAGSKVKVC